MVLTNYCLSAVLRGHSDDVRSITSSLDGNFIASVSRDFVCKFWKLQKNGQYNNYISFSYGEKYALVVKYGKFEDKDVVFIGGIDHSVQIRAISDGSLLCKYIGHHNAVSCIEFYNSLVLTGSWDCNLKLWTPKGQELKTLTYHSAAVWCLLVLERKIISGAADNSIVLWEDESPTKTFLGHTGPVRSLALLGIGSEFVSSSNDGSIRVWNIETGLCVKHFTGKGHYLYSIDAIPGYFLSFVTCGESNVLELYRDLDVVEEITIPGLSNWCVGALPNTDLVVGSSHRDILIFTRDPSRCAGSDLLAEYNSVLDQSLKSSNVIDGFDINTLQTVEDGTKEPGLRQGQTKLLRQDQKIVIYEWNSNEEKWDYIGDALRQLNEEEKNTSKVRYEGVEYDYVIDVELENGRKYKLPFNNGDNPDDIARKFLAKHSLPNLFHSQVVEFLTTNVSNAFKKTNNAQPPVIQTHQDVSRFKSILFKTTNISGLFSRIKSKVTNIPDSLIEKMQQSVESSLMDTPFFNQDNFPWDSLNQLLLAGGDLLLPTLDMIKQLCVIELFYTAFFIESKNCYHFNLVEFLNNFTRDDVPIKCRMLAIQTGVNAISHKCYFDIHRQNLDQFNQILLSLQLWSDNTTQLSLSSLLFNVSILLVSDNSVSENLLNDFFANSVWVLEAFGQFFNSEILHRILSSLNNLLSHSTAKNLPSHSLTSFRTLLDTFQTSNPEHLSLISKLKKRITSN